MPIKSLEELKKLRVSLKQQVDLREKGESVNDTIEVLVGMGTCGIAAGAGDTYNKFLTILKEKDLNVDVILVGCVGFCHMEPTIQVSIPGEEPAIYGKVTEDIVETIVDTVIIKREILDDNLLVQSFKKAVV